VVALGGLCCCVLYTNFVVFVYIKLSFLFTLFGLNTPTYTSKSQLFINAHLLAYFTARVKAKSRFFVPAFCYLPLSLCTWWLVVLAFALDYFNVHLLASFTACVLTFGRFSHYTKRSQKQVPCPFLLLPAAFTLHVMNCGTGFARVMYKF
jgi:hypothetical protein